MNGSNMFSRQGHRLLQIGIALFVFSGLEGFVIHSLPVPSLGRSVHTLSALQGIITLALGVLWPRLNLGATASRITFWTFLYSSFATIPLAAGAAHGSTFQETVIQAILYSAAPPFFASMGLIPWGLRMPSNPDKLD